MENLIKILLKNHISLTPEETEILKNKVVKRKIKRRQFLLQEGMVCQYYSFIMEGCFKMYGIDSKGIEYNIEFAAENDWIIDIDSFNSKKPSELFIEAIVPSTVLQISKEDLVILFASCPKFERVFRMIIEDKFALLQKRILHSISHTAKDRYLLFIQQYPALAQKLPSAQIASYIGITPEFLSKVRRNIANK